jgi:hypothetical protein
MAMNGDALGAAVADVLISRSTIPPTPAMVANMTEFWQAVCTKYVSHIQDNAEIPAGIEVKTTGSASAQTGATTSAGKVT